MSDINKVLDVASELHSRMPEKEAQLSEIDRQASIYAKVRNFCVNLRDFIQPPEDGPNMYLQGSLRDLFGRMLCGHGTETQAFNHLLSGDIILDHSFERTGDAVFGEQVSTNITMQPTEEGVVANFRNLLFSPKNSKYSDEKAGYYNGKVVLTKDLSRIEEMARSADARYAELAKVRVQLETE